MSRKMSAMRVAWPTSRDDFKENEKSRPSPTRGSTRSSTFDQSHLEKPEVTRAGTPRAAKSQEMRPNGSDQDTSSSSSRTRRRPCGDRMATPGQLLISAFLLLLTPGRQVQPADSLRFTSIQMPALVQRGTNFWLACQYELVAATGGPRMATDELLYSVKWYRNNEEFYRLIFGQSQGQSPTAVGSHRAEDPTGPFQQQYFSQTGVNVLMSASNATHVRLLNASLESDGSYACEISTQNLSTIRHEKEIKVYVLPHLKLNLIGLRASYAPGDRVELNCLSDFSRPAGALGWFINGRRIKPPPVQPDPAQLEHEREHEPDELELGQFELASSTKLKAGEPKLSRSSSVLKFKLTSELLELARRQAARDQSNSPPPRSQPLAGGELFESLKLECRYKLTEVSDVTFNELQVSAIGPSGGAPSGSPRSDTPTGSDAGPSSASEPEFRRRRRRRRVLVQDPLQRELRLAKAPGGSRVSQSSCPARRAHLLATLARRPDENACQLGLLALARDDPVILRPDPEELHEEAEEDEEGRALELALGSALSLNCSTLGAFARSAAGGAVRANQRLRFVATAAIDNDREGEPATTTSAQFCSETGARKRLLVSGRTTADNSLPQPVRSANQLQQQQQQQRTTTRNHLAYVELARRPHGDKLSLAQHATAAAADSSNNNHLRKSLGGEPARQLHNSAGSATRSATEDSDGRDGEPLEAPPLLEWFINNQEAPRSSASYTPELPLVNAPPQTRRLADSSLFEPRSPGGAAGERLNIDAPPLPSIDYVEYFANFAGRPIDQHLLLQLTAEKKHFMTPDSTLRLRCTSTQAQVLAADSLTVSLVPLPAGNYSHDPLSQRAQDQTNTHWSQRTGTKINPKYLHQNPRGQGRHRGVVAGQDARFANARGANPQYGGQASASEGSGASGPSALLPSWPLLFSTALLVSISL